MNKNNNNDISFILSDPFLAAADAFADRHHRAAGQVRSPGNQPYIVHPRAVARRLHVLGFDREAVAAALLHDTVEDTDATHEQIAVEFGPRVSTLVREVTNVSRKTDGPRAKRKALDRDHAARASTDGQSLKAADIDDNVEAIIEHDISFARVYVPEKIDVLRLLTAAHPHLLTQAWSTVNAAAARLGLPPPNFPQV